MAIKVSKYYQIKDTDGSFKEKIYFGTYANYVTVKRPNSENYEDLQTCLENLDTKIKNTITWNVFTNS